MGEPSVERSFDEENIHLECECGWDGYDEDIENWDVQPERDRVVRQCPSCSEPVPEWGALRPIDAAAEISRGSLRATLAENGYLDGE